MVFLDKLGWPVERVKGRPVLNFLRLLIHTRKIVRKWEPVYVGFDAARPGSDRTVYVPQSGCCRQTPCEHPGVGPCDMPASREHKGHAD